MVLIAALTNPDQATHLRAIKEIVALRKSAYQSADVQLLPLEYHNYILFSTTTILGGGLTLARGYLGQVQTTAYASLGGY